MLYSRFFLYWNYECVASVSLISNLGYIQTIIGLILLYYLFYEVFFSFVRKMIFFKTSPLKPDNLHLHMLIYDKINKFISSKNHSNYLTSLTCNVIFLLSIIPSLLFYNNTVYCFLYFIELLSFYTFFYIYIYFVTVYYEK